MDLNHTRLPVPPPEHLISCLRCIAVVKHVYNISSIFNFSSGILIFFRFFSIFFVFSSFFPVFRLKKAFCRGKILPDMPEEAYF